MLPLANADTFLEVVCGQSSNQLANVYFRWRGEPTAQIEGEVEGPYASFGQTLPARSTLQDLGSADGCRLLRAQIPDPVFWTPLHPTHYVLRCTVTHSYGQLLEIERPLGVRFFGSRGSSFILEARRWVFRGISDCEYTEEDFSACRELLSGMLLPLDRLPHEEALLVLEQATQWGIPLAVSLNGDAARVQSLLAQLSWSPSVLIAAIDSNTEVTSEAVESAANICLAQRLTEDAETIQPWANALWYEFGDPLPETLRPAASGLPAIMVRFGDGSPSQKRAACDELQRDLVRLGDFAGYIV